MIDPLGTTGAYCLFPGNPIIVKMFSSIKSLTEVECLEMQKPSGPSKPQGWTLAAFWEVSLWPNVGFMVVTANQRRRFL